MAEYIDKADIYKLFDDTCGVIRLHVAVVDQIPAADVVEVVRCNECKHAKYRASPFGVLTFTCELLCADIKPVDFCSYGERRDT